MQPGSRKQTDKQRSRFRAWINQSYYLLGFAFGFEAAAAGSLKLEPDSTLCATTSSPWMQRMGGWDLVAKDTQWGSSLWSLRTLGRVGEMVDEATGDRSTGKEKGGKSQSRS